MKLSEVKKAMILQSPVEHNGILYVIYSCVLKFNHKTGDWYYRLELLDKNKNSIANVPLESASLVNEQEVTT